MNLVPELLKNISHFQLKIENGVPFPVLAGVANAKFSLLKLLIYEPFYCYALVGWSARPRLEP